MNSVHAHCAEVGSARNARRRIQMVLLALPLISLLFFAPLTAGAARQDWRMDGSRWTPTESWTYYVHPGFPDVHFSADENTRDRSHMTYRRDNVTYRYYGWTNTFNGNPDDNMKNRLVSAWNNFHS
jgi:hypothetical protein